MSTLARARRRVTFPLKLWAVVARKFPRNTNQFGGRWGEVYYRTNKIKFSRDLQFREFSAAEAPNYLTSRLWRRMAKNSFFSPREERNPPPCQPQLPRTLRRCGGGSHQINSSRRRRGSCSTSTTSSCSRRTSRGRRMPGRNASDGPRWTLPPSSSASSRAKWAQGGSEELPPASTCRTPWTRPSVHGAALLVMHPAHRPVQLRPLTSPRRQTSAAARHPPPAPLSVDSWNCSYGLPPPAGHSGPAPFVPYDEGNSWKVWRQNFGNYETAAEIVLKPIYRQRATLWINLRYEYKKPAQIVENHQNPILIETLHLLLNHLKSYKKKNMQKRHKNFKSEQAKDQTINEFNCKFENLADSLIRNRFSNGIADKNVEKKLLKYSELTLAKAIGVATAEEVSDIQIIAFSKHGIDHKKSGSIRICSDPRKLNKALIDEQFQIPSPEEIIHQMTKAKFVDIILGQII
ncbi:hypothetical protein LAZ67_10000821 [Cordylochernes scorpioides]|uniref:Uncharacterized protein n=1 Tax=Cordylochernes scorpioides TaxID=51811 RepID=A0ABY6KVB7_9ARAC|nr:hypothetical protein LAZ67_10000821 [Cordylochernes scorpioides]